jgi:hypothetical protein
MQSILIVLKRRQKALYGWRLSKNRKEKYKGPSRKLWPPIEKLGEWRITIDSPPE